MRVKRTETSVYHCISRVVAGERLLDARAKEVLRKMIWQVADFSGVEVLTYCVMSNHFHVLVRVPEVDEEVLTREELLRRYKVLYGDGRAGFFPEPEAMATLLAHPETEEAARWEARLRARMHDVSAFMKTLNQRFSMWYNKVHERFGVFWAERFKSVLVEDDPACLQVVAAYIDLNPVRAGLAEDPEDYRWSGYGEAMGGVEQAQRGLADVVGQSEWAGAAADYRMVLFGKGAIGRAGGSGVAGSGMIPHERVREVLSSGGKVSEANLLRCRVRYLTEGAVFGSEAFVREVGKRLPRRAGSGEKVLGRLPVEDDKGLRSWRRLQVREVE